jgi:hypothetical protein
VCPVCGVLQEIRSAIKKKMSSVASSWHFISTLYSYGLWSDYLCIRDGVYGKKIISLTNMLVMKQIVQKIQNRHDGIRNCCSVSIQKF